jgi:hypothetical protein
MSRGLLDKTLPMASTAGRRRAKMVLGMMGKATMSQTVSCPRATMKNRKDGLQVLRI